MCRLSARCQEDASLQKASASSCRRLGRGSFQVIIAFFEKQKPNHRDYHQFLESLPPVSWHPLLHKDERKLLSNLFSPEISMLGNPQLTKSDSVVASPPVKKGAYILIFPSPAAVSRLMPSAMRCTAVICPSCQGNNLRIEYY
jgi:hypothetical protein